MFFRHYECILVRQRHLFICVTSRRERWLSFCVLNSAVGSLAGQLAKSKGAYVVGIAGGAEKCQAVVKDFHFDACIA